MILDPADAVARIRSALKESGLALSSLSLGNNFNQDQPEEFRRHVEHVIQWLRVAAEAGAPVSRIFGGSRRNWNDTEARELGFSRVLEGMGEVVKEAE